jgi:hypothetical protein
MKHLSFEHVIIDPNTPGIKNDVCLVADVDGDGNDEIIIGGKEGENNVVWYKYPSLDKHTIGSGQMEAGGVMVDITGNGLPDLVAGNPGDYNDGKELFWYENSGSDALWTRRVICNDLRRYHNQAKGDIDGDGKEEIIFLAQDSGILGYYKIPDDYRESPWPKEYRHIIKEDFFQIEGLEVADINNDGKNEIIAGPYWFEKKESGWKEHRINPLLEKTCVAVADINGDGKLEIILSEGEKYPAKLVWYGNAPYFDEEHILADDLFHPHSLLVVDIDNDGKDEIIVGEMGLGKHPEQPRVFLYKIIGDNFEQIIMDKGKPTHEAKILKMKDTGRIGIVNKPFDPGNYVEMWIVKSD